MNEMQRVRPNLTPEVVGRTNGHRLPAGRPSGFEIPGAGLKHDYAGLLEYWQMIRRHKALVMLITVLGAVAGFLVTVPSPRIYQARATLEIQGLNEDFLNMRSVNPTLTEGTNSYPDYDIQTQIRIIQSRSLLRKVAAELEKNKSTNFLQPADRLSAWRKALRLPVPTPNALWAQALTTATKSVKVRSSGTNRIVEVSTDSTSPQLAALFVNTLVKQYIEDNLQARWESTEHTGEWLTKQLQDLKIKLEKAEDELQRYAKATGLVYTDEKNNVDDSKLVDLQKELSAAAAERVSRQSRFEMAAASPVDALPDVLDDTNLRDAQVKLIELRGKLAQLRVTFTPNQPDVRRVQAEIANLEGTMQGQRTNILTRIRNELLAAERRENLLNSSYTAQASKVSEQSAKAAHYQLLKREVDANRVLYDSMLQKLKEASIASALNASNIRVVDPAEPPSIPYKPDVPQRITVGLISGIFLGVAVVVIRERADRTLQDPGDAAYYLGLPELGVVPLGDPRPIQIAGGGGNKSIRVMEDGGNDRIETITWSQKSSLLAESFRTILTSILFSGDSGEKPQVLVLTSSSPKEGKTTLVCNLGISITEINRSVLIIDGDMRRPRMHSVFDVPNNMGLSNLLLQKDPLDSATVDTAIHKTQLPGLSIMPSGSVRHGISGLLHSGRLPEVMNIVRSKFDMVLIDTPPMVNISDARILARLADDLILVLRSAVTTRDAALLAKGRFAEDGLNVMGTILNSWNPNTPGYSYYRYYYAGYYHYYSGNDGDANQSPNGNGDKRISTT